jgi:predicted GIY-YIG superfamily endonuclease
MKIYVYGLYKENFLYQSGKIDEGLFYIGIAKNLKERINGHKSKNGNPIKAAYIKKYGVLIKVLYECSSYQEASEKETFLIKWFGRIQDNSGILTNILIEPNDISKANLGKTFSSDHKNNMSLASLNRNEDYWKNQRDKRLTVPIEEIHKILHEWENSFPIDKKISKKYGIKLNIFNWWIRKYRPDLRNLVTQNRKKHIEQMQSLGIGQADYAKMIGVNYRTISAWYCKYIRDKKPIQAKKCVKDLEYKKQKYKEWIYSGLSKRDFCSKNNINYSSFKAWKTYYEEY